MTGGASAPTRRRRILSACCGVPDWSEATAAAYGLNRELYAGPFDAVLIHLLSEAEVGFFNYLFGADCDDPAGVGNVRRCVIDGPAAPAPPALVALLDAFAPDVLIAWGATPARLLRRAMPTAPLVLMVSHCARLESLIEAGAVRDFLAFRAGVERGIVYRREPDDAELEAFALCDLAVLPSDLARFVAEHFYTEFAGKMVGPTALAALADREAKRFSSLARPFAERDIDVLFVADRWDVAARNLPLAVAVSSAHVPRSVHVVGECDGYLPAHTHGAVPRRRLYELLGRSKTAVFPGLADAAPRAMFAASAMGCNLVASPDCGFWRLCHDDLLAAAPTAAAFAARMALACTRPFADRRGIGVDDSAELIETLAVF